MNIKDKIASEEEVNSGARHDFIFQFICADTGNRSEAFSSDWTQLGDILDSRTIEKPKPTNDDYILLVAVMDKEQTHIPTAPLITVDTYLQNVRPETQKTAEQQ